MGSSSIYSSRYSFEGGLYGRVVNFCTFRKLCVGVDNRPRAGKRGRLHRLRGDVASCPRPTVSYNYVQSVVRPARSPPAICREF